MNSPGRNPQSEGTCELCGKPSDSLRNATIEGAQLEVCPNCAPHADTPEKEETVEQEDDDHGETEDDDEEIVTGRKLWDRDTSKWEEEGVSYEDDPLPYLVRGYSDILKEAMEEEGLTREELADEIGFPPQDIHAVEEGEATQAGVGGSLIKAIEERLDITLSEESF